MKVTARKREGNERMKLQRRLMTGTLKWALGRGSCTSRHDSTRTWEKYLQRRFLPSRMHFNKLILSSRSVINNIRSWCRVVP